MKNRIIKFRVWDKDNGISESFGLFERPAQAFRKDIELMQFTGLLDKNGKEIYEGDILKWNSFIPDSVEGRNEKRFRNRVVNWGRGEWILDDDTNWCLGIYSNIEILGNIYENKELLK